VKCSVTLYDDKSVALYTYSSTVLKEKSVCDLTDYTCQYYLTSYQFSDSQIACYTPAIPEVDRPAFITATKGWGKVIIKLTTDLSGYSTITCAQQNDCSLVYTDNYSPKLINIEPQHLAIGQDIKIRLKPKSCTQDQLMAVKIGRNNCVPVFPDGFTMNWSDTTITCKTGQGYVPEYIGAFMVNFMTGFTAYSNLILKTLPDPTLTNALKTNYYFKVFPKIDSISLNSGTPFGGSSITIKGAGFDVTNTKVYIDNDLATTSSVSYEEVKFTSPVSTLSTTPKSYYIGSQGLRRRVYSLPTTQTIDAMTKLASFPDATTTLDEIILETSTAPTGNSAYGQFFHGFFKAIYTGKYTFFVTSDDASQVWLSTDDTPANKEKIIDFTSYTAYNDYLSLYEKTKSAEKVLTAGNYYYFEIYHVQTYGLEHFRLGVEIEQTAITSNLVSPLPNQEYPTKVVSLLPLVSRDLYQFNFGQLTATPNHTLTCKFTSGNKSLIIDPTKTAAEIKNSLALYFGDQRLIVRKVFVNENGQYLNTDPFDDASFTTAYSFSDMFLNIGGAQTTVSIPMATVSTGTKTGIAILVFIDRKQVERTFQWDSSCGLVKEGNTTPINIVKKQSVAGQLSGTFRLKLTDPVTSQSYTTVDIDSTKVSQDVLQDAFNNLPTLMNKVQVYYSTGETEAVTFYLKIGLYADVNLAVDTNNLKGGIGDAPQIKITDFTANVNKKMFFMPIPADFLYVKSNFKYIKFTIRHKPTSKSCE
jgi:hypothetical protein